MFLKKKQATPHYEEEAEEQLEDEEELNDDELNALYEEEENNSEHMDTNNDEEQDENNHEEEDDDEDSEVDEKSLSFAERLALSSNKQRNLPKDKNKKNRNNQQQQHHTPARKKVEKEKTVIEKKNKNAPKEVSSKIRPRTIPNIAKRLGNEKKKSRDPRFDAASSSTDPSAFKQFSSNYRHVFDQVKDEIDENRERLRDKSLSYDERNEIQRDISRLQTRNKKYETQKAVAEVKDSFYRREKKLISEKGKRAYFLKDSDVKRILKERKVDGIKKSGKMNKFIKKTKRKDKSKVASLMPITRRE